MPRRGNIAKRDVLQDPVYNSKLVTRLINNIMLDGKKGVAQKIVYGAFDIVAEKTGKEALEVFEQAMENIMPVLEVKARRLGGATYQVPMEVRPERRQTLGLRWITKYSRERNEKTMKERLAGEILDALNGTGGGTGRTLHPDNMAAGPASYGMTDTLGRMHSDAQFAGSSSVPAHVEMMGLIGMGNNPMVGATVACAVAVEEAMK